MSEPASIKKINRRRRFYWIINALLKLVLKLDVFRDKNLWVYGCWEGTRYDDNSRYLFEHVSVNHPEIESVWLSPNQAIVEAVRKKGFRAEKSNSWKGICVQLRAGVFFFTNGIEDIGNVSFIHGAFIVGLWHGTGMKNVYHKAAFAKKGVKEQLKSIKDKMFDFTYQDCAIATSEKVAQMRSETYLLPLDKILITGQPRNDVFKTSLQKNKVLPAFKDADDYTYILYMPTYRHYENHVVEDFVVALNNNESFIECLEKHKVRFLLKLHYLTKIDKNIVRDPFFILSGEDVTSVQELLSVSDYMITDYSGCCIDFALKDRTIVLYAPDFDRYCKTQGIKEEWYQIYQNQAARTVDDVVETFEKLLENGGYDTRLNSFINEIYESPRLKGSCYSENVYEAVKDIIK